VLDPEPDGKACRGLLHLQSLGPHIQAAVAWHKAVKGQKDSLCLSARKASDGAGAEISVEEARALKEKTTECAPLPT